MADGPNRRPSARAAGVLPRPGGPWTGIVVAAAVVGALAVYVAFLGTYPFDSEPLFVYVALLGFLGAGVLAARTALGSPSPATQAAAAQRTVVTSLVSGGSGLLAGIVTGTGGLPVAVAVLAAAVAALAAGLGDAGPDAGT